jgi:hypothetical protein
MLHLWSYICGLWCVGVWLWVVGVRSLIADRWSSIADPWSSFIYIQPLLIADLWSWIVGCPLLCICRLFQCWALEVYHLSTVTFMIRISQWWIDAQNSAAVRIAIISDWMSCIHGFEDMETHLYWCGFYLVFIRRQPILKQCHISVSLYF